LQISPNEVYNLSYDFIIRLETYIKVENEENELKEKKNKIRNKFKGKK
jgi:hypothetical protein